jgi:hypothetical protein
MPGPSWASLEGGHVMPSLTFTLPMDLPARSSAAAAWPIYKAPFPSLLPLLLGPSVILSTASSTLPLPLFHFLYRCSIPDADAKVS